MTYDMTCSGVRVPRTLNYPTINLNPHHSTVHCVITMHRVVKTFKTRFYKKNQKRKTLFYIHDVYKLKDIYGTTSPLVFYGKYAVGRNIKSTKRGRY